MSSFTEIVISLPSKELMLNTTADEALLAYDKILKLYKGMSAGAVIDAVNEELYELRIEDVYKLVDLLYHFYSRGVLVRVLYAEVIKELQNRSIRYEPITTPSLN